MSLTGLILGAKVLFDKVKDAATAALKNTRTVREEFKVARKPELAESVTEATLKAPLRRLQSPTVHDNFVDSGQRVVANVLLPSQLTDVRARQFFDTPGIVDALREVQAADVLERHAPSETLERLARRYEEVASANSQESTAFLNSIRAVMVANITTRVDDVGAAATTAAATEVIINRINRLESDLGKSVPDQLQLREPDAEVLKSWKTAFAAASKPLLGWRQVVGAGTGEHIDRPELARLHELLEQDEPVTCALLGDPGSGKSALLSKFAGELSARDDLTVLAIKADLISRSVTNESDLQADLGLPEPPSMMLRKFAKQGKVVLLLDQVDALADRLDLKTSRLSLLLTLIQQMSFVAGVRVFLSCRRFEFSHDTRLTTISAQEVSLALPSWEEVVPILQANGVAASGWPEDAKNVLRVPQQLNTFLQLRAQGIDEPVTNYQAMLERLWNARVVKGQSVQISQLAYRIAEVMADREELWLSRLLFEDANDDLTALLATGVITEGEHGKIGFSHQTVFEYALARSFVKTKGGLSTYVLGRMDSLFVRPKVLYGLTFLRNTQSSSYKSEFKTLWASKDLRAHLRFLLIDFLGSQVQPSDQETIYMVEAFETPELRPLVLKSVEGGDGWFKRLANNIIPQAMVDDALAELCFPLLTKGWSVEHETVTHLLTQHWAPIEKNDRATLATLRAASIWTDANLGLAKLVLQRGTLGTIYVEPAVVEVSSKAPVVAIQMLRWYLDSELERRTAQGAEAARQREEKRARSESNEDDILSVSLPTRPVLDMLDDNNSWDGLQAIAEQIPEQFIGLIWPWFVNACRTLASLMTAGDDRYFGYPLWFYVDLRFEDDAANGLTPSALLETITFTLEKMAIDSPDALEKWVNDQEGIELTPVQRLISHALAQNPARFAKRALEYLLADDRRFYLGSHHDSWSTSVQLVEAVSPHWDSTQVTTFTAAVKRYSPPRPPERNTPDLIKHWSRTVRRTRLAMVRALPARARTDDLQKNIDAETRIFPQLPRSEMTGGLIGSPISVQQLLKATPAEIANAVRKVPDGTNWDHPKHFHRGGNIQLARAIGEAAAQRPELGMAVLKLMQPSFGQRTAGAIVSELAKDKIDSTLLMETLVDLHKAGFGASDSSEFRYLACQAVNALLEKEVRLSDDLLAVLESWLVREARENDPRGPVGLESNTEDPRRFLLSGFEGGQAYDDPDYTLLRAIVYARYQRQEKPQLLDTLRQYHANPHSSQAWEGVLDDLVPLTDVTLPGGKAFIGELLASMPELDGTRGPAHLMARIYKIALPEIVPSLRRWRDSSRLSARKGYGELVALIAIVGGDPQMQDWLTEIWHDPQYGDARLGATASAVQLLWHELPFRPKATELLIHLMEHDEKGVWEQLFELFTLVDRLESEPYTVGLLEVIAAKIDKAPIPQSPAFVERLNTLLPLHAQLIARIARPLIRRWKDQLKDPNSPLTSWGGQHFISLVLTLHGLDATRLEGLAMFEQLLEIDAFQARATLDEIDHRIRPRYNSTFRMPRRRSRRRAKKKFF
ncbi:hypothetical protein CHL79_27710 [Delftia acidovorans]|uniref:ATP-binding protein n=1 Tax=Delftia acidovorans TaxID=80866 RepID=UPI000BC3219B|nr:ATP-binding protein [Delftia acidovorans]ATH15929.1 hypothetical protein CHL79_27710 [Delftia acidovorans]